MANERKISNGWTSPSTGAIIAIIALVGLFCSVQLLGSELKLLSDPDAILVCDVNPLIACSDALLTPESHLLFGLPNSMMGIIAFSMLLAIAAVLLFRGSLPRVIRVLLVVGAFVGLIYVVYFLYLSISYFGKLCPYCMGVWAATLAFAPLALGIGAGTGAFGQKSVKWGQAVQKYWWAIALVLYLIVVLVVVLGLGDKIGYLFS